MGRQKSEGNPHISRWPRLTWFGSNPNRVPWKRDMTAEEAAQVIERFLDGPSDSIEWCDFAETGQEDPRVERYRRRCDELSLLVNRPGGMDEAAVAELRSIIEELRSTAT
jgi:hypothetical protein